MNPLLILALAAGVNAIERGQFWWTFPDTDCLPDDELGTCGTPGNATVQECKAACFANPNCGGFNLPNGHLKKLGCMDGMKAWPDDPNHHAPIDPGHHALTLYTLSLYPPRREYWWDLKGQDCNAEHELGNCLVKGLSRRGQIDHCKAVCQANIFCEGFNLPFGHLKAAGCKDDIVTEPSWGNGTMELFYRRGHPQPRPSELKFLRTIAKADCNPGQELGNCSQYLPPPYTESECFAACHANPLCGGFNLPNGHLKTVDCIQDVNTTHPTHQDLYYFSASQSPADRCLTALHSGCGKAGKKENCFDCVDADQDKYEKICTLAEILAFCDPSPAAAAGSD